MSYYNILGFEDKLAIFFLPLYYHVSSNCKEGSEVMDLSEGEPEKEKRRRGGRGRRTR
jgi:hypothetical protein